MSNKLKERLKDANTINQVINEVNKEYNLDAPLGVMSKMTVTVGLTKLLETLNIPKRVKIHD